MANRKRNIQVKFDVTAEEREMIRREMENAHTNQLGAYLRKMAIDRLIIYTDVTDFKEYSKELSAIGRNINQIAKRLNSTNTIYDNDVAKIKERLDEIWQLQRCILMLYQSVNPSCAPPAERQYFCYLDIPAIDNAAFTVTRNLLLTHITHIYKNKLLCIAT